MRLSRVLEENPSLDHEIELHDGDIVSDLLTLVRVVKWRDEKVLDGLIIGAPDNMTAITQYGLICASKLQVARWMTDPEDTDD